MKRIKERKKYPLIKPRLGYNDVDVDVDNELEIQLYLDMMHCYFFLTYFYQTLTSDL